MNAMITQLRTLVMKELDPVYFNMDEQKISYWLAEIPKLSDALFQDIWEAIYSTTNKKFVRRHINQIQYDCVYLLDILQQYQRVPEPMVMLFEEITNCLQKNLKLIEMRYPEFFDLHAAVPLRHFKVGAAEMRQNIPQLQVLFNKLAISATLKELIFDAFDHFLNVKNATYAELVYLKDLQDGVVNICNTARKETVADLLSDYFYAINFNNTAYVQYCKQQIVNMQMLLCQPGQQIQELLRYQQLLCMQQCTNKGFIPTNMSLIKTIKKFVHAELKRIRSCDHISVLNGALRNDQHKVITASRVCTSLSVDVLVYFFKLLKKAGAVDAGPSTHLFTFISKNFQTPGVGSNYISETSLKMKYQQVVQSTAKSTRLLLLRMVKLIDDEFEQL